MCEGCFAYPKGDCCEPCEDYRVGSYEASCNDYALFGDQRRDDDDYEFNAAYDRYDGYRGDVDCGDEHCNGDCTGCNVGKVFVELTGLVVPDDCPF